MNPVFSYSGGKRRTQREDVVRSFATQRAERSECRDEHHCASEFNSSLVHPATLKSAIRKGCVFLWRGGELERAANTTRRSLDFGTSFLFDVERNGYSHCLFCYFTHCVRNGLLLGISESYLICSISNNPEKMKCLRFTIKRKFFASL